MSWSCFLETDSREKNQKLERPYSVFLVYAVPFLLLILSQIVLSRKISWYIIGLFNIFILYKMPGLSCIIMTIATYRSTEGIRSRTLLIWSCGVVLSMLCKFTASLSCPKFRLYARKALYLWRNKSLGSLVSTTIWQSPIWWFCFCMERWKAWLLPN